MSTRVCLILPDGYRREQLWHEGSEKVSAELGFECFLTEQGSKVPIEQWPTILADVDAVITSWGAPRFTEQLLPQSDRLKVIAHAAGSVEPIVSPAIFERGIKLLSCNRYMADSVAEYALMMTMVGLRRLNENAQFGSTIKHFLSFTGGGIKGLDQATVGIWGFGDVAKHLIRKLKGLGSETIIVHNDYLTPEIADELGVEKVGFDEMFERSDVIHLCESLREDTVEKVRAPQLTSMKDNAVIINSGRARLAHEQDLLAELQKGRIIGIFDVHFTEPLSEDSPFRQLDNVVITPHFAGSSGRGRYTSIMLTEVHRILNGQTSEYEISPERAGMMTSNQLVSAAKENK
jgi:phosphoglycerate dehydrogenase-like enzyme